MNKKSKTKKRTIVGLKTKELLVSSDRFDKFDNMDVVTINYVLKFWNISVDERIYLNNILKSKRTA